MGKREVGDYLIDKYSASIKLVCLLVGIARSSWYYLSKKDDTELELKLQELAEKYPTRGFDNYYGRLRRTGHKWGRKRVLRVYRSLGLVRRKKRRRKLPVNERKPMEQLSALNEIWALDFMSDTLTDGRQLRVFNAIDEYNRESLISRGSISFPSARVIRELEEVIEAKGKPKIIRVDNGPEFRSGTFQKWCSDQEIEIQFISPGRPMENGKMERLNRTFREDILDAYLFSSISQFNIIAQKWVDDYNETHPHESLGGKSPQDFATRPKESFGVLKPQNSPSGLTLFSN